MKISIPSHGSRPAAVIAAHTVSRSLITTRPYATQNTLGTTSGNASRLRRRAVTAFNDDGSVPWNELSAKEKTSRATQQTYNFGMIVVGLVLTSGVVYFLWTDVFSPDSKAANFNRAVNKIKKDQRCLELFGEPKKIMCHGEETFNKWRRARPVASSEKTDPQGNQHIMMHFHVDGPLNKGVARLHMIKGRGESDYEYKYLFVDVRGHERVYLENAESSVAAKGKKQLSLFGVKWG